MSSRRCDLRWVVGVLVGMGFVGQNPGQAEAKSLMVPEGYPTIQKAVDAAQDNDTISVAPGVYKEDVQISRLVSGPTFTLAIAGRGSQPGETVIQGSAFFNMYAGSNPLTETFLLSNLTVRAATPAQWPDGVNIVSTSNVLLDNCIVEGHERGIRLQAGSKLTISRSLIRDNTIGIALDAGSGTMSMTTTTVTGNRSRGIDVVSNGLSSASLAVRDSVIAWNGRGIPAGSGGVGIEVDGVQPPSSPNSFVLGGTVFQGNRDMHVRISQGVSFTDEGGNVYRDPNCMTGACKIVCGALFAQGYLPADWYAADLAYANRYVDAATTAGYHAWAAPLVDLMERSALVMQLVRPLGYAWAKHMAYEIGASREDSRLGRFLSDVGIPLNRALGKLLAAWR